MKTDSELQPMAIAIAAAATTATITKRQASLFNQQLQQETRFSWRQKQHSFKDSILITTRTNATANSQQGVEQLHEPWNHELGTKIRSNFQLHLVRRRRRRVCETSLQNPKEYGWVIEEQSEPQIKPQHMYADKPALPGRWLSKRHLSWPDWT